MPTAGQLQLPLKEVVQLKNCFHTPEEPQLWRRKWEVGSKSRLKSPRAPEQKSTHVKLSHFGSPWKPFAKDTGNKSPSCEEANKLRPFQPVPTCVYWGALLQYSAPGKDTINCPEQLMKISHFNQTNQRFLCILRYKSATFLSTNER